MSDYVHLRSKLFDNPLAIWQVKLDDIMKVVGDKLDLKIEGAPVTAAERGGAELPKGVSGIAVLPVHGTLVNRGGFSVGGSGLMSYDMLTSQVRAIRESNEVQAVVMDIDSNGGEVAGLFEFVDELKALKKEKPLYAIVNSNAMSAAYAIASTADKVYVPEHSMVGNVGVVVTHRSQARAEISQGIEVTHIFAGARKAAGSPHAFDNTREGSPTMDEETRNFLQAAVDQAYDRFVGLVAENRGMTVDAVIATKAAPFIGKAAVVHGLADEVIKPLEAFQAIAGLVTGRSAGLLAAAESSTNEEVIMPNEEVEMVEPEAAAEALPEPEGEGNEVVEEAVAAAEPDQEMVMQLVAEKFQMLTRVKSMCELQGIGNAGEFAMELIKDGLTLEACALKILDVAAENQVDVNPTFSHAESPKENVMLRQKKAQAEGNLGAASGNPMIANAIKQRQKGA